MHGEKVDDTNEVVIRFDRKIKVTMEEFFQQILSAPEHLICAYPGTNQHAVSVALSLSAPELLIYAYLGANRPSVNLAVF